jgi:hypothetical protein
MNTHAKGSRWRLSAQRYLDEIGFTTRFRSIGEAGDDITAISGDLELSVEAKNVDQASFGTWVDQAERNAPSWAIPLVIAHRRGRASVDDAFVVMSGKTFRTLIWRLSK